MNGGLFVPRSSRRNRSSEHPYLLSGEFLNRYPLSVLKNKNHRPIKFRNRIFVAVWIDKTTCRVPPAIVGPNPVRACTHYHRPNTTLRFLRPSLCKLICKHQEHGPPQRMVVVRHQFRLKRFKKYCFVFDGFHEPILQYAGCDSPKSRLTRWSQWSTQHSARTHLVLKTKARIAR